jgi:hypothetical protein
MANLTVKDLPDSLYEKLKSQTHGNHRSIASGVTVLLERVLGGAPPLRTSSSSAPSGSVTEPRLASPKRSAGRLSGEVEHSGTLLFSALPPARSMVVADNTPFSYFTIEGGFTGGRHRFGRRIRSGLHRFSGVRSF